MFLEPSSLEPLGSPNTLFAALAGVKGRSSQTSRLDGTAGKMLTLLHLMGSIPSIPCEPEPHKEPHSSTEAGVNSEHCCASDPNKQSLRK